MRQRLFFTHVMKAAGTTVLAHLGKYVDPERRCPTRSRPVATKSFTAPVLAMDPEDLAAVELFSPHAPFALAERIGFEGATATILRHPVERALSHLALVVRRLDAQGVKVEPAEVIGNEVIRRAFLSDHQTRVFSLRPDELDEWDKAMRGWSWLSIVFGEADAAQQFLPVPMAPERLDLATAALERLDVVGITERLDLFAERLHSTVGGWVDPARAWNVAPRLGLDLDESLVAQLQEANQLDIRLYEHACALVGVRPDDVTAEARHGPRVAVASGRSVSG